MTISVKYILLKRQIKNLSKQIELLYKENSKQILDISLIDKDLEHLASELNKYHAKQRQIVAGALKNEENLKESIANLSHDLRTPLTVIIGHLQLLQKYDLSIEQNTRIKVALEKAQKMKELIGGFYNLSLWDMDKTKVEKANINFTNLLLNFLSENTPIFECNNIQPHIILPDKSIFMISNPTMLERILQNLVVNAVRYTAGGITIKLCQHSNGKVTLTIENMVKDAENLNTERIFERFYTGDKSRNSESTGIGLVVVKLLVEKLNGKITTNLQSNILSIKVTF